MFLMKIFDMYYQLNKGNSVFLLHTQLHEPIQNFHLSSNHVHMLKTKGLLWSYKKDFSQTFPHIHIMYLKSVHAHSLAIFLACQLFLSHNTFHCPSVHIKLKTSVYKGYKQDKIEMRGDRAEMSDFPLYLNTVAGGLDRRDQTIGGFSFVVKIYAVPVVEIIG